MGNEIIKIKGDGMPKFIISDEENTKSSFHWPTKCNLGDTIILHVTNHKANMDVTDPKIMNALKKTVSTVHCAFRHALTFLFISITNPHGSIHCLIWIKWINPETDEIEIEICKQEKDTIAQTFKLNWNVTT